jgi:sulfatase modifying factor 1
MKIATWMALVVLILVMGWVIFHNSQENATEISSTEMVFIPGGSTVIGSMIHDKVEAPVHVVKLEGFYMDKHPVTVAQFQKFIIETNYKTSAEKFSDAGVYDFSTGEWFLKKSANWEYPQGRDAPKAVYNHPVTQVSWHDANAYAQWVGKELPTETQWEYAARNAGKISNVEYPWGTNSTTRGDTYLANTWQGAFPNYNSLADGYLLTSPVGTFDATPLGLMDMVGNVWEWCSNWKQPYGVNSALFEPNSTSEKIQRGGSFLCDPKICHGFRVSARTGATPETSLMHVGFRCVKNRESEE